MTGEKKLLESGVSSQPTNKKFNLLCVPSDSNDGMCALEIPQILEQVV